MKSTELFWSKSSPPLISKILYGHLQSSHQNVSFQKIAKDILKKAYQSKRKQLSALASGLPHWYSTAWIYPPRFGNVCITPICAKKQRSVRFCWRSSITGSQSTSLCSCPPLSCPPDVRVCLSLPSSQILSSDSQLTFAQMRGSNSLEVDFQTDVSWFF